jgi:hypothetical protein
MSAGAAVLAPHSHLLVSAYVRHVSLVLHEGAREYTDQLQEGMKRSLEHYPKVQQYCTYELVQYKLELSVVRWCTRRRTPFGGHIRQPFVSGGSGVSTDKPHPELLPRKFQTVRCRSDEVGFTLTHEVKSAFPEGFAAGIAAVDSQEGAGMRVCADEQDRGDQHRGGGS